MKPEMKSWDLGLSVPPGLRAGTSQRDVPTTPRANFAVWKSRQIKGNQGSAREIFSRSCCSLGMRYRDLTICAAAAGPAGGGTQPRSFQCFAANSGLPGAVL